MERENNSEHISAFACALFPVYFFLIFTNKIIQNYKFFLN